ncbi:hypothetical protein M0804_007428 [Polistes exclamans]|nr:hypothetical protein M0804_007428 [Polistes exclamans]
MRVCECERLEVLTSIVVVVVVVVVVVIIVIVVLAIVAVVSISHSSSSCRSSSSSCCNNSSSHDKCYTSRLSPTLDEVEHHVTYGHLPVFFSLTLPLALSLSSTESRPRSFSVFRGNDALTEAFALVSGPVDEDLRGDDVAEGHEHLHELGVTKLLWQVVDEEVAALGS